MKSKNYEKPLLGKSAIIGDGILKKDKKGVHVFFESNSSRFFPLSSADDIDKVSNSVHQEHGIIRIPTKTGSTYINMNQVEYIDICKE